MKKRYRIKKNSEIDAIFKKRVVKGDSYFVIYQSDESAKKHFRFSISIGRKYGNAVQRNLAKRRIRMIMTEFKDNILAAKAFVVVVKPAVIDLSYEDMRTKLAVLLKKSKLMENEND